MRRTCLLTLCLTLATALPAAAQFYTITDLGVLQGQPDSRAAAVNRFGHVAGTSGTSGTASPCRLRGA